VTRKCAKKGCAGTLVTRRHGVRATTFGETHLLVTAAGLGDVALRALGLEDLRACGKQTFKMETRGELESRGTGRGSGGGKRQCDGMRTRGHRDVPAATLPAGASAKEAMFLCVCAEQ